MAAVVLPNILSARALRVVTTTTDLKAITEAVGGSYVTVTSICTGLQDPHFIEAKPSYMVKLRKADLFIRIGLQLEIGWEPLLVQGSRNGKIQPGNPGFLDASTGINRLEVPTGPVDRSLGDIHPEGNPHYWLDPYNGRIIARTIAERLMQLDPAHRDQYREQLQAFLQSLDAAMFGADLPARLPADTLWEFHSRGTLEQELIRRFGSTALLDGWAARMAPLRGIRIITYHKSWSYFLHRFGLTAVAQLEPKPGVPPSPKHILNLIRLVQTDQVPLILMEPFYSDKAPRLVAQKTGIKVLKLGYSVGGDPDSRDYLALIDTLVNRIADQLSPPNKEATR
jgi:ABC-type Zn uptake system ZnuABC Zn-binding protein ZnuA